MLVLAFSLSFSIGSYAQEYPIYITDQGYIVVAVTLGDSVKANFLLDTGAGAVVLSQKTFDRIESQARETGYFTGFRHDGDRLDGVVYQIPSLAIGEHRMENVKTGIYPPLDDYGVEGLVSMKFFEDQPFSIDFKQQKLRLLDKGELEEICANNPAIPLSFTTHTDISLDIFIPICLNEEVKLTALFDTGSGYSGFIVNPYYLSKLKKEGAAIQTQDYTAPISQDKRLDQIVEVDQVDVCSDGTPEDFGLKNTQAVFREGMIYEALIGTEIFRDRIITIDIPGKQLIVHR